MSGRGCGNWLREKLLGIYTAEQSAAFLDTLSSAELKFLLNNWELWAREEQLPPSGDWRTWVFMGGRGAGKTRAGAEWVRGLAMGRAPFASEPVGRIALVGETFNDVREVMIDGVSGILAVCEGGERPSFEATRRRLVWKNGAIAQMFSAEDPESLRGPQFGAAWCDELAKWKNAQEMWDMLQFGLRLGENPRQLVTTTPRAIPLLKRILSDKDTVKTHASTQANAAHLSPSFLAEVEKRYAGTRLGRQELDGELIEDRADSLWRRGDIEAGRVAAAPDLVRIVVAVDPPASAAASKSTCGIMVVGVCAAGVGYVLEDASLSNARPNEWATEAIAMYHKFQADALVAEVNQGGDMVSQVLSQVDASVPVKPVRAMRGKFLRAEPVAALYAQGRVKHVGTFAALEDELCDFASNGLSNGHSPDRLDALVWALTHVMMGNAEAKGVEPRMRWV